MRDAAQAKAALQGMADAVKAETAAEVAGSTAAAAARQKDIAAIQAESQALSQLANSAKQTNTQLLFGGRNDMTQHLSDLSQELNYTTLLNRQKWLGFSSVQQAMSYRQQMYALSLLENKAHFAGYLTADQYLGFLQRETMQTAALSAAIRDRSAAIGAETALLLAHANALQGTHASAGSLGEGLSTVNAYNAALIGLPNTVQTRAVLDDSQAMAQLATYRAALMGLPRAETTDIVSSATRLGGIPFTGGKVPVSITPEVTSSAAARALAAELKALDTVTAHPRIELVGGPEAVTEATLLAAELKELDTRSRLNVGISFAEVEAARLEADALQDELEVLDGEVVEPHLAIEGWSQAQDDLDALSAMLTEFGREHAEPQVGLRGADLTEAELAALNDAMERLDRDESDIVINVDATGAISGVEEFIKEEEKVPKEVRTSVEWDGSAAEDELDVFVGKLIEAARKKYEFYATMNDAEVLDDLNQIEGRMLSAQEQGKALMALLGRGGAAGGGGGGPPPAPPGAASPGEPDPADAAAWNMLADAMERAGVKAKATAAASKDAGTAANTAGNTARGAGGLWGFFTRDLTLFGGVFSKIPFAGTISVWALALHTLIDFFIVLVPAVIAASVALGAFAVAAEPATKDVIAHLTGVHTALDALGTGADNLGTAHFGPLQAKAGSLNATMSRLPVTIRTMQGAMAPTVVTIFGAAINTLTGHMGLLQSITQKAGTWVEDMVIKIQQAVSSHSNLLGPMINTATNDMHILAGIGTSILKILGLFLQAGQMTHVSELLFEGIAYALSVVQKALNAVGPYALAAGIAFFSVVHYGGLLATQVINLVGWVEKLTLNFIGLLAKLPLVGGAFEALGVQTKAAFAAIPASTILAIAAAIGAVGYAIYAAGQASSQAKAYVGGLISSLANDNASQGFAQIQTNLSSMNKWLAQSAASSRNFVGNMAQGWSNLTKDASGFGLHLQAFKDLWEAVTGTNQQPGSTSLVLKQLTAEQKDWTTTLETAAATTKQYGTSVQQSFALMDLAGVKVTDDLATQETKVKDLVTGWLNMGVAGYNLKNGMNQLGAAVDAVTLASEVQNSQITALTGDFTSFLTLVDSGQNSFEAYATGINTVGTNSKVAGASMGGLNAVSLTLRQSWEANLTAGQTLYNNLLLQNAAAGNNAKSNAALAASGRDIVNSLLAQGGATTESVQGAYALAQTMGYTGKATYDALLKWSGGNQTLKGTTADLNKQVGILETGSANLTTDVQNLASAINTNLNQAIAAGLVNMPQMTKAVANFYQYVLTHRADLAKGITPQEVSLSKQVANALIAVYGTSPQGLSQAKDEFLATLSQMGIDRKQALALWAKDQPAPVKPTLDTGPLQAKLQQLSNEIGQASVPAPAYQAQSGNFFNKTLPGWFAGYATSWQQHWVQGWQFFYGNIVAPMGKFFTSIVPGWFTGYAASWQQHWVQGWQAFNNNIFAPMGKFFTVTVPGWFTGYANSWSQHWVQGWQAFNNNILTPMGKFFTVTVPGWFTGYANSWSQHWIQGWQAFNGNILAPMGKFFTTTIPGWFAGYASSWSQHWVQGWQAFNGNILAPMQRFFVNDIPGWWNSLGTKWNSFWSSAWTGASQVLGKIESFFTTTLPNAMWNSLRGGIDHVIGGLNTVIGWINSVTSVVGIHIGTIPTLAAGGPVHKVSGSVPGTGDEDGTHIIAMGGEFMLRKPARMALQAAFGPDFLDALNNADTWLGSGSRGNTASQRRGPGFGRHASGGIVGDITNWLGDVGSVAGAAWHGITGAASDVTQWGEQAVFNAMWNVAGAPAQKGLEALGTPGDMGAAWLQNIHTGISNWMTGQTTAANAAIPSAGTGGGIIAAMMKNLAAARGWTGAQWSALYDVENREAGFNMTAQNPTSGAYGLAQFINGPGEYAQYGGNSTTALGQVTAMLNYIAQRYGTPEGAWAHEQQFGWYAGGGPVAPTSSMGFGLASGGGVPAAGLSNVAAMFGGGMAAGGVVPNLFVPGLSANLSRQLSAATAGQLPRTLSDAAGNRVGLQVDNLTINNPRAEKPSDSITRASNRLAFLGGRGMV
jgi:hypothetical protein